jgi:hypothetical protein
VSGRRTYSRRSVLRAGLRAAIQPANPLPELLKGYQGVPVPPAPAATVPG